MQKEDNCLDCPKEIHCLFNALSEEYKAELTLRNNSSSTLYFYIVSTFGRFMRETTTVREIAPSSHLTLQLYFKSTNIISQTAQLLALYASPSRIALLAPSSLAIRHDVALRFPLPFESLPEIEAIILEEIEMLITEAELLSKKGLIQQAKHKYEQGFQLLRRKHETLLGMAEMESASGQWQDALRDIETALIYEPNCPSYLLMKAKILQDNYSNRQGWEVQILEESYRILNELQRTSKYQLKEIERKDLQVRMTLLKIHPRLNRINMLKKAVFHQALERSHSPALAKCFPSRASFQRELQELFFTEESSDNATPEEILDPISYEIMQSPVILPSGNSVDSNSLQMYFKTNGYKDPISRMDLQPQWLFPNHSLQNYIRDHPKLKEWQQYEHEVVHH